MKKKKQKAYAIVFNSNREIFTTIGGMGIFDHLEWAKTFQKQFKLERDSTIITIEISYTP